MTSSCVSIKSTDNIRQAAQFAQRIDRPLNTLITLKFNHTALSEAEIERVYKRILTSVRQWFSRKERKRYGALTWVMVWENPNRLVPHPHWQVHIPEGLRKEFENKVIGAFVSATGRRPGAESIVFSDLARSWDWNKCTNYLLKGMDAKYQTIRPKIETSDQGEISFNRRVQVSRNIGPTARQKSLLWNKRKPQFRWAA